jgi:hypothetical protein
MKLFFAIFLVVLQVTAIDVVSAEVNSESMDVRIASQINSIQSFAKELATADEAAKAEIFAAKFALINEAANELYDSASADHASAAEMNLIEQCLSALSILSSRA